MSIISIISNKVKNWIKLKLKNAATLVSLMVTSIWYMRKYRAFGKKIIRSTIYKQILFTGFDGLSVIAFVAYLLGAVVLIIGASVTQTVGAKEIYAILVKYVLLRELAPLFTAIILVARSGTAIATEIGNMKVNQEIDVLTSMGINVRHFIVGPRIIGFVISITALTIYFYFVGVFGGYLVINLFLGLDFHTYLELIFMQVNVFDIFVVGLKSVSFGLIISTVSCYNGFLVKRSSTEVPIYSTKGVVSSLNLIFLTYGYITALSYI
jgi:phospholipid/cholesterol/gamma-HCH transport system permease protein